MNFREGIRRIGLAVGFLGFCAGSFGSYLYVSPILSRRNVALKFRELISSPVVAKEVEPAKKSRRASPESLPSGRVNVFGDQIIEDNPKPKRSQDLSTLTDEQLEAYRDLVSRQSGTTKPDRWAKYADPIFPAD